MFAVIFSAEMNEIDSEYFSMAGELRTLAIEKYGCIEFKSFSEHSQELAISYWPDLASIKEWKNCSKHIEAQEKGKNRWYKNYKVEVVELKHSYSSPNAIESCS
ncbi:antibiotic biosynthesis monooxygenase [Endozoicomonas sp. OPT23]|uniref:antibiotic biosynthesis monooxygenase family protein n=1 Tax=Endozoicomonas sp. OPT23 TaxID=2072845 RepID=UPI00129B59AD|nr:antibiotic biosynthesis monooxygenase [Endozoicomonas sp. OPT23]MRI34618.1 antibiotic biosynthesis monooxygenase [Endozoicomonas sp. OPT23]